MKNSKFIFMLFIFSGLLFISAAPSSPIVESEISQFVAFFEPCLKINIIVAQRGLASSFPKWKKNNNCTKAWTIAKLTTADNNSR